MKIGLMLGGGGGKGAYQVGLLKALEEYGILKQINAISGSSIGALNGYFYLASNKVENLIKAWEYGTANNPFSNREKNDSKLGEKAFEIIDEMAFKYANEEIFKQSKTDMFASLTEITGSKFVDLIKRWAWKEEIIHLNCVDNPLEYVKSSASLPIILGFGEVDDKTYVDGGFTNNNPIEILIEKGCKIIFVSSLDLLYSINRIKNDDVIIINLTSRQALPRTPIRSYLAVIDFDYDVVNERIKYGYFVAKKMIEYIIEIGLLYKENNNYVFSNSFTDPKKINIPNEIENAVRKMKTNNDK